MKENTWFLLLLIVMGEFLLASSRLHFPLRRIDHSIKRNAEANSLSGGISSNGAFYAQVSLGTPPQSFLVQVDTGSSDFLVYGSTCTSSACVQVQRYNMEASSSSRLISCSQQGFACASCQSFQGNSNVCSFSDSYGGGGNPVGYMVTDSITVGQFPTVGVNFGMINTVTGNFEWPPASGIWGLAYPSMATGKQVFDSIVEQLQIPAFFSMCLRSGNAVMSLGEDYSSNPQVEWTPVLTQNYYTVNMTDLKVAGNTLGLPARTYTNPLCVVDSGTTYLLFPQSVYDAIHAAFQAYCAVANLPGICGVVASNDLFHGACYHMSAAQIASFPVLQFQLGNMSPLTLTANEYLVPSGYAWCLGIGSTGNNGPTVLGDIFMQRFHVIFDRVNNRVGFADISTCPTSGIFTEENVVIPTNQETPTSQEMPTSQEVTSSPLSSTQDPSLSESTHQSSSNSETSSETISKIITPQEVKTNEAFSSAVNIVTVLFFLCMLL